MTPLLKYPRTPHLAGSRQQPGDEDLATVARDVLAGLPLVVEEKMDGSNAGVSFDAHGKLQLQSRGHYLEGGPRERQFDLLKRWAHHHSSWLWQALGHRHVMYGEWLFARHTIAYDRLPHYFLEFDIFDRSSGQFLSTPRRRAMLAGGPVVSVPVLAMGVNVPWEALLGSSTAAPESGMEGLYIKHEEDGQVLNRYKFVRATFVQAVEQSGEHWMERPIEANGLQAEVDLFA